MRKKLGGTTGVERLREAIGAEEPNAYRALLRHRLRMTYLRDGRRWRAGWQGILSLIDLTNDSRGKEGSLRRRIWRAGAYLRVRKVPFIRDFVRRLTTGPHR